MNKLLESINLQPDMIKNNFNDYVTQANRVANKIKADFNGDIPYIIFTGMGASYFAAQVPFNYIITNGHASALYETSELTYYQVENIPKGSLMVMISQSGESVELINLAYKLSRDIKILSITNNEDSTLGIKSDYIIKLNVTTDGGIAISTYISSILSSLILSQKLLKSALEIDEGMILEIVNSMKEWIDEREEKMKPIIDFLGQDNLDFIAVARGPSLSSADETALLFKEVSKMPCINISGGQLRHGSVEMVNNNTCVINFAPKGRTQSLNFALTRELLQYGAKVILISDGSFGVHHPNLMEITLGDKDEFIAPIYDILPCQFITYYLAEKNGIKPGIFINTAPVIRSE